MTMPAFKTIFDSLKGATDITKGLIELKKISDVGTVTRELNSFIIETQAAAFAAQSEQSTLIEEKRNLKEKIIKLEAFTAEKVRYQLAKVGVGGFAYALKESMSEGEPAHYLCANCYGMGRKSILNPKLNDRGFADIHCSLCQSSIPTGYRTMPEAEFA